MKFFIIILLATFFSCTHNHTKQPAESYVLGTELNEVTPGMVAATIQEQVSKQDSIELINTFRQFCDAITHEKGILLSKLSTEKKFWPSSLNAMLDIPGFYPEYLLTCPNKKFYKEDVVSGMNDSALRISKWNDGYSVSFNTLKKTKRFNAKMYHGFLFVKLNGQFKFDKYETYDAVVYDIYPSIDSITAYFPKTESPGLGVTRKGYLSNFENIWYSQILYSCSEPILYNYTGDEEIYRFSWFRSFHNPVIIRVQKNGFSISLSAKELRQGYGDDPDNVVDSTERPMSYFQWQIFKNRLDNAKFWDLPLDENDIDVGMDGAEWVMEAYKNGNYHFIQRWSARATDFGKACKYLIIMSGLDIDKKDIY